jgi:hypothetical protein
MKKINEDYTQEYSEENPEDNIGIVLSKKSVDAQIKAYFQRFEQDAVQLTTESRQLNKYLQIIFEQEAPPAANPDETVDALDQIVSDVEDDSSNTPLAILAKEPNIDIDMFASDVGAFLSNIENKLDFKNPVVNMAVEYIKESYGEDTSNKLIEAFKEYGFKIKVKNEV